MPKIDIFEISWDGKTPLDNGKRLSEMVNGVELLVEPSFPKSKKDIKSKKDDTQRDGVLVPKGAAKSLVAEISTIQLQKDLLRAQSVKVEGVVIPLEKEFNEENLHRAQERFISKNNFEKRRLALYELHQGISTFALNVLQQHYRVSGNKLDLIPPTSFAEIRFEKEGENYSTIIHTIHYVYADPMTNAYFCFIKQGDNVKKMDITVQQASEITDMQKKLLSKNPMVTKEDVIKEIKNIVPDIVPICSVTTVASIDLSEIHKPNGKPKGNLNVEIQSDIPQFQYTGPKNALEVIGLDVETLSQNSYQKFSRFARKKLEIMEGVTRLAAELDKVFPGKDITKSNSYNQLKSKLKEFEKAKHQEIESALREETSKNLKVLQRIRSEGTIDKHIQKLSNQLTDRLDHLRPVSSAKFMLHAMTFGFFLTEKEMFENSMRQNSGAIKDALNVINSKNSTSAEKSCSMAELEFWLTEIPKQKNWWERAYDFVADKISSLFGSSVPASLAVKPIPKEKIPEEIKREADANLKNARSALSQKLGKMISDPNATKAPIVESEAPNYKRALLPSGGAKDKQKEMQEEKLKEKHKVKQKKNPPPLEAIPESDSENEKPDDQGAPPKL